jgi:hypothetical protein
MAGTIIVDRIESDASYASTINVANKITFSNTVTFQNPVTVSNTITFNQPVTVANTFVVPVGSASVPSITPTGDNNTGIFFPAADTIAFSEGGSESLRISNTGNLSIGTTTSTTKILVDGILSVGKCQGENDPRECIRLLRDGFFDSYYHSIFMCSGSGVSSAHFIDFMMNNGSVSTQTRVCRMFGNGNMNVSGALSKGSGSFQIKHPLLEKEETHYLVHSFIEGPQADLIYRGKVQLENGVATVNIDDASNMTEGTFIALNRGVQCFTSNETDWDSVRGSVNGNILTIECQNNSSNATISWMVIGERKDKHMYDTDWTDENGKVIVEPLINPTIEE